jgi:hypothetical protein
MSRIQLSELAEPPAAAPVSTPVAPGFRLTALDWAMLGSVGLSVALDLVWARLAWGWPTAVLTDVAVGGYLLALASRRAWRPLLGRLFFFGAVAGLLELATDAAGEQFARSLVYPAGTPLLWASPVYMPLAWALVLTQVGYLGWRLAGTLKLPWAMLLTGMWAGANIPFYEEIAYHAGWWRYAAAPRLGHTPLYVLLFEALIGASLPLLLRAVERRRWRLVALLGALEGAWMPAAALFAWLVIGR